MTKPAGGTNINNAMNVLFPMPQIQLRTNAPQFHPPISPGTTAACPCPDVFSICMVCAVGGVFIFVIFLEMNYGYLVFHGGLTIRAARHDDVSLDRSPRTGAHRETRILPTGERRHSKQRAVRGGGSSCGGKRGGMGEVPVARRPDAGGVCEDFCAGMHSLSEAGCHSSVHRAKEMIVPANVALKGPLPDRVSYCTFIAYCGRVLKARWRESVRTSYQALAGRAWAS